MDEIFDVIVRLNRINEKLTELLTKIEYQSKSPAKQLALEYINSDVAARLLHVSKRTLANMRMNGTVPFSKVGRKVVYSIEDLRAYLERGRN